MNGGVDEFGVGEVSVKAFDAVIPELGFNAAKPSVGPLSGDEGVDERELGGTSGTVVNEKLGGEGFEFGGIFARDDVGPRVNAGSEAVERGYGFAFLGDGTGGFLGVEAIGFELRFGRHGSVSANS